MRRRVLVLMLGLLVGGAPQALALCHFACAASMADAAARGHQGHSCSHLPTPSTARTFEAGPHVCGHADELPEAAVPIVQIATPPAVLNTIFTTVPPLQCGDGISCGPQQTPSGNNLLGTPLRV
jgi:hypothetical protein